MGDLQLSAYAIPEWSSPQEIERALAAIRACVDEASSTAAYQRLLHAVGNDHAGIYFPVAVPVVRMLDEMLAIDNAWARRATLEALMDLSYSFAPAPPHYVMPLPDGGSVDTEAALRDAISSLPASFPCWRAAMPQGWMRGPWGWRSLSGSMEIEAVPDDALQVTCEDARA